MDLSIIIVNWNTRDLLLQCLKSVYEGTKGLTFEIIIVDNASADNSVASVRALFPQVQLIENEQNVGFAKANNQAICISQGDFILLLNSDTIVQGDALTDLVRFANQHPQVGIVGPQLLNEDRTLQPSWAEFPTVRSELLGKNFRKRRPYPGQAGSPVYEVDSVGGASLLIRRAVMDQIGLMDEWFFMYSEEIDWCFRTKQGGWRVCYYPEAQVIHLGGQSSKQASIQMKIELYRSKLKFFYKHYGAGWALLLGLLLQASFFLKALAGLLLRLCSMKRSEIGQSRYQDSITLARAIGSDFRKRGPGLQLNE